MQTVSAPTGVRTDERRSVIIQMGSLDPATQQMAQVATRALSQRSLALSARDCLPPDRAPNHTITQATPAPNLVGNASGLRASLLARFDEAPALPDYEDPADEAE